MTGGETPQGHAGRGPRSGGPLFSGAADVSRELVETEAMRLFAENALSALRGPLSRGAVPGKVLAQRLGISRTALARRITVALGQPATPFDLVVTAIFQAAKEHRRARRDAILAEMIATISPQDPSTERDDTFLPVIEAFFSQLYAHRTDRRDVALAFLIEVAAATAAASGGGAQAGTEATADGMGAAARVAELAAGNIAAQSAVEFAGIRLLLRMAGLRPKPGVTVADIVLAMQCTFDGYVLRHLLDAETWPMERLAAMLWSAASGMCDPGPFLAEGDDASEAALLRAVLDHVEANESLPGPDDLPGLGRAGREAHDLLADPARLASSCLALALGHLGDLRPLAAALPAAREHAIRLVFTSITDVARRYRVLCSAAPMAPVWSEAVELTEALLSQEATVGGSGPHEIAERLVGLAREGQDGKRALETVLLTLFPAVGEAASPHQGTRP